MLSYLNGCNSSEQDFIALEETKVPIKARASQEMAQLETFKNYLLDKHYIDSSIKRFDMDESHIKYIDRAAVL